MMYIVASDGDSPLNIYFIKNELDIDDVLNKANANYLDLFDDKGNPMHKTWKFNYTSQVYEEI